MPKRFFTCVCLCLFLAGAPFPVRAEGLDDASIRALYARAAAAVGDPDKTHDIMDEKLDDFYTLKSNLTQIIGDNPPQTSALNFDKTQTIENALRGYSVMQVDRYKNTITNIQYSENHQYAYVTDTTASSGTVSIPLPGGGYKASTYEDGEGCVDQLAIVHEKIKFLQSACNEKFVVKK